MAEDDKLLEALGKAKAPEVGEGGEVEYPDTWDYRIPGNTIMGKVTNHVTGIITPKGTSDLIELEAVHVNGKNLKKPEMRTIWLVKVLKSEIERQKIAVGDDVAFKAFGKAPTKRYYNFAVIKGK